MTNLQKQSGALLFQLNQHAEHRLSSHLHFQIPACKFVNTKGLHGLSGLFLEVDIGFELNNSLYLILTSLDPSCSGRLVKLQLLMHNILCLNFHQSGQCSDITRPVSKSKLALHPLAPIVPHYQCIRLQGQTTAPPPARCSISHTYCTRTKLTIFHTSKCTL